MEALNHIFYFNMGLNCPTEVVSQFSIFSPNTPLQDHCEVIVYAHNNLQEHNRELRQSNEHSRESKLTCFVHSTHFLRPMLCPPTCVWYTLVCLRIHGLTLTGVISYTQSFYEFYGFSTFILINVQRSRQKSKNTKQKRWRGCFAQYIFV